MQLSFYNRNNSFDGVSTQPDFEEVFSRLKNTLKNYTQPIVSREKRNIPHNAFTVLISCILSLRTKDEVTAQASERLLQTHNTPQQLLQLSEEDIAKKIYPVGFYKTKAKRIHEISQDLLDRFDGEVPTSFEDLLSLKGVGRKTANIVMVYGHQKHGYLPIDTHCHRIPNRLGWIDTTTPEETEYALKKILPEQYWDDFNDLFVLFGQTICVPISPFCSTCPIQQFCEQMGVASKR